MAGDSFKKDLNWIKKYYGEEMMHMCRRFFPQILEVPGALPRIIDEHFAKNHHLVADILSADRELDFKAFVFKYFENSEHRYLKTNKSAVELMDEAGYILYPECQTEEEIQEFKKYYGPYDKLCTFDGGRLNVCRVWFAVKKDVENIKREDFEIPQRDNEYGTSVISIQFSKGDHSTLSIKNRYNDSVDNPDNTFYSNLDNIIPGLTDAFERDYGAKEYRVNNDYFVDLNLKDYIRVGDKYYHYNYKIDDIFYCENNIIFDLSKNLIVEQLDSNSQILMDYFIVDLKNKIIKLYDHNMLDGFVGSFGEITNITKQGNTLTISVKDGEDVIITLNDRNQMISLYDPNVKDCGTCYLRWIKSLTELNLPNVESMGYSCFWGARQVKKINAQNLRHMGECCFSNCEEIEELNLQSLQDMGRYCFNNVPQLKKINEQNLRQIGEGCFSNCEEIEEINVPKDVLSYLRDVGIKISDESEFKNE